MVASSKVLSLLIKLCVINSSSGTYDAERVKQGEGTYIWMGPGAGDDETPVEIARYTGNYKDGMRHGVGRFVYPNGDIYEGEFFENKMHGEGSYTYKKSGDIYSGSWVNDKKNGRGVYEFGADKSILQGEWVDGQITKGEWVLKGAAVFTGEFKLGRPFGEGKFVFNSTLSQTGAWVQKKLGPDEEEEPVGEGEAPRPPNVTWEGKSIVSF